MSKRPRRNRPATKPRRRAPARRRAPHTEEPDLIDRIAATLDDGDPLPLLAPAGTMVAIFDPRSRDPFRIPRRTIGKADGLVAAHFGVTGSDASARAGTVLRAIRTHSPNHPAEPDLGTPRYLTGQRRARTALDRDRSPAMVD